MLLNDVFKTYKVDLAKLNKFGFIKDKNYYIYKENIIDDLYALFKIKEDFFSVDVYDEYNNLYLPFNIKNSNGLYALKVKDKVSMLKEKIIDNCFYKCDVKSKIIKYVYKTYKVKEEYPWDDNSFTIKVNGKWFLLFMNIKYKSLNVDSDSNVDIINLKLDFGVIKELTDYKTFFPAYHMNKKYWLTVVLDNNIDINIIYSLIDQSYNNVKNK